MTIVLLQTYLKAKFVVCVVHTEKGDLITGDSNGTVYIWGDGGNKITNFVKHGHDVSLCFFPLWAISKSFDTSVTQNMSSLVRKKKSPKRQ